jgi:excisionase family DNA binding protein
MNKMVFEVPAMDEILSSLDQINKKIESIQKQKAFDGLLFTTKETCVVLKISLRSLQTYRDSGLIPFIQFGREVRFRQEDIQNFLNDHFIKSKYQKGGSNE